MNCPQCQRSCERCDDSCGTFTCPNDQVEFFFYNDNYVFGRVDTCKYIWNPKSTNEVFESPNKVLESTSEVESTNKVIESTNEVKQEPEQQITWTEYLTSILANLFKVPFLPE